MSYESVLLDVKQRGIVEALRIGEASKAIRLDWSGQREAIIVWAQKLGVSQEDALAAFGLPSGGRRARHGRGRGTVRRNMRREEG